jgi:hypothetical protein
MASWRKALRDLTRRDPVVGKETMAVHNELYNVEGDRGAALIGGSMAENALETIIRTHLIPLGNDKLDELFGFESPIGSFSSKIKISFAFGFIEAKMRDDYDRIREIRNAFAHCKVFINFNTPEILNSCYGFVNAFQNITRQQIADNPRRVYINTTITLMSSCTMLLSEKMSGNPKRMLTYADTIAWREKWLQQFQQQTQ